MKNKSIFIYFFIFFSFSFITGYSQENAKKPQLVKLPYAFSNLGRTPKKNTPIVFGSSLLIVANYSPGGAEVERNGSTWGTMRVAMFDGTEKSFFKAYFPTGMPLTQVSAKQ